MKLSAFKQHLGQITALKMGLPDGSAVPAHFHITEAGLVTKNFIDCGGTIRQDRTVNFQLWVAGDDAHRLEPKKLLKIISIYEQHFTGEDLEVEIEYQTGTIGKYGVDFQDDNFVLTALHTDCLAKEQCQQPVSDFQVIASSCCTPGQCC